MIKKMLFVLGLLVLATPAAVQAQDQEYDFTTNTDGISVTITFYNGSGGNVTIPATLGGLPVTAIANRAFEQTGLTQVTIPEGVITLGNYSFFDCSGLTNVTIPGSVNSIGDSAFEFCTILPSITIPAGVASIGNLAFSYCYDLTNATIGDGVTILGTAAFFDCESLASVIIPAGVTNIGATAFNNCTSLGNVAILGSVGQISIEAFQSCSSLTNVTIADGVTNIAEAAFDYCVSLVSINIPEGVTSIGDEAFESCASLTSLIIPASVANIGDTAFADCTSLSNLYFQGNAPAPGASAFLYDNDAKAYYLPDTTGWKSTFAGLPTELTPTYVIKVYSIPFQAHATVGGNGHYLRGTNVTVTAFCTNDCYNFLGWWYLGRMVSANPQFTFTTLKSESLFAKFALVEYEITTSSFPSNWGITVGGGKKGCGTTATLRAIAKPGFAFTNWTTSDLLTFTNTVLKFPVDQSENLVANFIDIEPPKVTIIAPQPNEKISTADFTIKGTASDNAAVTNVYYNLNGTGWQPASSTNNYAAWFANVVVAPNSANTVEAEAVDSSGNVSSIKGPITFSFE